MDTACIAERLVSDEQRMQSFVCDPKLNPFNVVALANVLSYTHAFVGIERWKTFVLCCQGVIPRSKLVAVLSDMVEFGMTVQRQRNP